MLPRLNLAMLTAINAICGKFFRICLLQCNPQDLPASWLLLTICFVSYTAANILLAVVFGLVVRFLPGMASASAGGFAANFISIAAAIVWLNLMLAVFNLVPVPPLDGSKLLFAVLPHQWRGVQYFLEQYGFFLLLVFIFFFSSWLLPVIMFFFRAITGSPLFF